MNVLKNFCQMPVEQGSLAILWLGQAGFLIKDSEDTQLVIDPYLTDCVERLSGYKRLMMPVVSPEELKPDIYLCTHSHDDHLDVDAVPVILQNGRTVLLGPSSVMNLCRTLGIPSGQLIEVQENDVCEIGNYKITVVYADHGTLEPDAVGFVVENGGITIYFTGDTSYCPEKMAAAFAKRPDIIVLPINGEFGNMDAREAALAARDSKARVAVPSHFWTLAVHRGDPFAFGEEMEKTAPGCQAKYFCQGETYVYHND